jgi:hypothetical protein
MDWSNERYVRLYVRDTKTWKKARWEGQCLFMMLLRIVDRAGVLDDIEDPVEDLSLMTGLPEEVVQVGYERLEKSGAVELRGSYLLIPNFIEAQEASKSDAQRQRESREGRRARALSVTKRDNGETECDSDELKRDKKSQVVTTGHNRSQVVTPTCADPVQCSADPVPTSKNIYTADFLNWYSGDPDDSSDDGYPWKVGKMGAFRAWKTAKRNGLPGLPALKAKLREQKEEWAKENNKYVPKPKKYLEEGYYDNEPKASKPSEAGKSLEELWDE